MNFAKVSANGQITIPVEIRSALKLKEGDKILFIKRENGDVVIDNASATAIVKAQKAFKGAAVDFGVKNDADVQKLVDELRYGGARK